MSGTRELDGARVAPIAKAMMQAVVAHFKAGPESDRILEVLNALAFTVASVLAGSDADPEAIAGRQRAREFYDLALQQNIDALREGVPHD